MSTVEGTVVEDARVAPARNGIWNGLSTIVGAMTGLIGSILIIRSLSTQT